MPAITASQVEEWNGKADKTVVSSSADGLMPKEDKTKLDGLKGVRYGTDIPTDMKDGELFIHIVEETE